MSNQEIAKILYEISQYLAMESEPFKPRAYEKVAEVVVALSEELALTYKREGLKGIEAISGIGTSIGEKIEELLVTGHLQYYEKLRKKTPVDLAQLSRIEGLGPKKMRVLYKELGITNVAELEAAAKAGKIKALIGFGEKSEENILRGIAFLAQSGFRLLLGDALPLVRQIVEQLRALPQVQRAEVAGSVRRWKETVGDADILVISAHPKTVMDFFVAMPGVSHILGHGETKSTVKLHNGFQIDLRVVPEESYGAALNYFTGSKDHNVALRQLAIDKGLKLNEYGLFRKSPEDNWEQIAGGDEEGIYRALSLDYIPHELREMTGEIDAASRHELPTLIGYDDLRGDLQTQTNWTDGANTILEMANAAMAHGLQYMVITDHTKRLAMTHGLDEVRIQKQMKEIDRLNSKFQISHFQFKILKGTECDILKDGSLDLSDEVLAKLDVVGVSVHSLFNLSREEQTKRIIRAMENPNADILFHPTGRLINKRPAYDIDIDAIIAVAKRTGTILEIDAFPDRLDLRDEYIRKCVVARVKMCIDSDAHDVSHFSVLEFGIAQARRGWATKKDIINARPVEEMLAMLKK